MTASSVAAFWEVNAQLLCLGSDNRQIQDPVCNGHNAVSPGGLQELALGVLGKLSCITQRTSRTNTVFAVSNAPGCCSVSAEL